MVRLNGGRLQSVTSPDAGVATLDRRCLLVYQGSFESMDGPVTITEELMRRLADNHNARPHDNPAQCQPIQLDHSTTADQTVGRLVGRLAVEPIAEDTAALVGDPSLIGVPGLFGTVRFIGRENVEKGSDGRWTNVSIGADFELGELNELSVTPFPAAPRASLLSRRMAEGSPMNLEAMKGFVAARDSISLEEAEAKIAAMSDEEKAALWAEVQASTSADNPTPTVEVTPEPEPVVMAEGDDKDKPESDEKKMAAKKKVQALLAKGRTVMGAVRLEAARADVAARLSKLRSDARISPAEQKRLAAKKFEEKDEATRAAIFDALAARDPIVSLGQFGSVKAVDVSVTGEDVKKARLAALEKQVLADMPMAQAVRKNAKKMSGGEATTTTEKKEEITAAATSTASKLSDENGAHYLAMIHECLEAGDLDHAKSHLKTLRSLLDGKGDPTAATPPAAQMAALQGRLRDAMAYTKELEEALASA